MRKLRLNRTVKKIISNIMIINVKSNDIAVVEIDEYIPKDLKNKICKEIEETLCCRVIIFAGGLKFKGILRKV